jgi:hypothetical protein
MPSEACNAVDDDCDTLIDEGFECAEGASRPCTAGACSGNQSCQTSTCTWGTCDFGVGPTNDDCAGALPDVSSGGTFVGSTCAARNDFNYVCGGTTAGSSDVIFRLSLPGDRNVVIDTVGTAFDAMLFIRHAGACPGTTADRCDDNTAGGTPGQARITWNGMPAGDYWVILDGAGAGNRGAYVLNVSVSAAPPPANDVCTGAINITGNGTYAGSTGSATDTVAPSCTTGTGGRDVWYRFTLTGRRLVYVDVADGNAWDSVIDIRTGTCAASTSVACNNDACGGVRSQWHGFLNAGTYYVVVDGASAAATGSFNLFFQTSGCTNVTAIAANGDYNGTTVGAGSDHNASCGGWGQPDVDYYIPICADRPATAHTCNATTTFDTVLYFRAGDCGGAGREVACNDNDATCTVSGTRSRITGTLPKGLNFLIVDGNGAQVPYRVTISGL